MSNVGQAVLTVGGAVVGSFFGAPQLGYLLGSLAGQAFFPTQLPTVRGPKLEDAKVQTSTLGAPIPWVWGTYILAGQVIWRSPFIERKVKEKAGGKGGPEQTSIHYEYRINVAIGLCKGPIVGVRRIWADTKLIYDASAPPPEATPPKDYGDGLFTDTLQQYVAQLATSEFNASKFDLYLGDETQTADATIETWEGVGNVPGYRGLAYIVFRDFELADYGNRIPNFRVEVMTAGTLSETSVSLYANDYLAPWAFQSDPTVFDPRNSQNNHVYCYMEDGGNTFTDFDTAIADMNSGQSHGVPFVIGEFPEDADSQYIHGWSRSTTPNFIRPCEDETDDANLAIDDYVTVQMTLNYKRLNPTYCRFPTPDEFEDWYAFLGGKGNPKYVSAGQGSGYLVATEPDQSPSVYFEGIPSSSNAIDRIYSNVPAAGTYYDLWVLRSHEFAVRRALTPPDRCYGNSPIPGTDDFCVTADGSIVPAVTWTKVVGTWNVLQKYAAGATVTSYPLSPARPSTDPEYSDQAFWEAAYADAVANGDMPPGLTYGVDYPESQSYGYVGTFGGTLADPSTIPLSDIIADICEGCGLTDYDVSDLTTTMVHGYALTVPATGRDGIEPLRAYGYFDAVESGDVFKFVQRGQSSVATLEEDDLGARVAGSSPTPSVRVVRTQDQELPRLIRAHYIDLTRDGDPGQSEQERQEVQTVNISDVQVPAVMSKERGKEMASTLLFEHWIARNSYQFSLPIGFINLEPTDCILLPVDGELVRVRITSVDLREMSLLEYTAVRDEQTIYSGLDVVGDYIPVNRIPIDSVPSPSVLLIVDVPPLRSQDDDCGYYAAARGVLSGWPGAILYRATSEAGVFKQVAWTSVAATIGIIVDAVPIDSPPLDTSGVDDTTTIRVNLLSGSFESVSADDLIAGENLIAVGGVGDWELIRFQTAVQDTDESWILSGLLRGQLDTAIRDLAAGDDVVLMTGPGIMRVDEAESANGATRVLRAVTSGTSLEDAESYTVTVQCDPDVVTPVEPTTVISRTTYAAPLDPACDDTYIVPSVGSSPALDPTDPWYGHEGSIARYDCTLLAWEFTTPNSGTFIYVIDEDNHVYWDGVDFSQLGTAAALDFDIDPTLAADSDTLLPTQAAVKAYVDATIVTTTHGDLIVRGATEQQRLGIGNNEEVLQVDTSVSGKVKWGGIGVPQNAQSGNYGIVLADNGRHIHHASGAGAGDTYTLPANGTLALPIGFAVTFTNLATDSVQIAITTDTLYWAPSGATGTRTLAQYGVATAVKVTSTAWMITGVGLS